MNKKIIAILALAIVCLTVGTVSAFDLGDLSGGSASDEAQNITIDGIDFTIPAGFEEEKDLALDGVENETSGVKYTTWGKTYTKGSDVISIGVATYDGIEIDDSMPSIIGGDEKTVNGVKGYEYDFEPFEGFTYAKDGKLIIVSVKDSKILDEIIVK